MVRGHVSATRDAGGKGSVVTNVKNPAVPNVWVTAYVSTAAADHIAKHVVATLTASTIALNTHARSAGARVGVHMVDCERSGKSVVVPVSVIMASAGGSVWNAVVKVVVSMVRARHAARSAG